MYFQDLCFRWKNRKLTLYEAYVVGFFFFVLWELLEESMTLRNLYVENLAILHNFLFASIEGVHNNISITEYTKRTIIILIISIT